jgi:Ca-activated chloride channel homolog
VLRPTDSFNVIVFESGSEVMAPVSLPATAANVEKAVAFIGPKNGGGGTEMLAAMKRAIALPRREGVSRSVVLLTDGYISAEKSVFDYIRENLDETNVFAFGIGTAVNRHLIEGVAHAGQGEPFVVTGPDQAAETAGKFRRYIDSPVMTGIDVEFTGFDAYDVEPRKIPDLFASRPIVVFGKWRGTVGGTIAISGRTGREPYRAVIDVAQSKPDDSHGALRHLWARTRVANLGDYGTGQQDKESIAEITSLGLTYGLLTPYTSFVAVHEVIRRTSGDADEVDQSNPLPDGVTDLAVGAEPELVWVMAVGAVVLILWRRACASGAGLRATS